MTKKRFIKLLMAKGLKRNEASVCAWFTWKLKIPYHTEIQDDFYDIGG